MRCLFGHKFGQITDRGRQYCERCGKTKGCFHEWVQFSEARQIGVYRRNILDNDWEGKKIDQTISDWQCKYCGKLRQYNHTTGRYSDER